MPESAIGARVCAVNSCEAIKADPQEVAFEVRSRMTGSAKLSERNSDHMIAIMDECLTAAIISELHGNMRSGIARDLHQTSERMVAEMQAVIDHMAAVAKALNGRG